VGHGQWQRKDADWRKNEERMKVADNWCQSFRGQVTKATRWGEVG
jgi:hypothetical protein